MRERVGVLNGKLVIDTAPGRGTRIVARLPLPVPQHHSGYSVSSSVSAAGSTSTSTDSTIDVITGPAEVIS